MHSVLLLGPPGSGKVTRARAMTRALTALSGDAPVDLAWIYHGAKLDQPRPDVAGGIAAGFVPFRAPHHTCSEAALVGGGHWSRPGEASLAHGGTLLLDELSEFRRSAIDALACVLHDGSIRFPLRGERYDGASFVLPARPQLLLAAANACPCGYLGSDTRACQCSRRAIASYVDRLASYTERLGITEIIPCRPYTLDEIQRGVHFGGDS